MAIRYRRGRAVSIPLFAGAMFGLIAPALPIQAQDAPATPVAPPVSVPTDGEGRNVPAPPNAGDAETQELHILLQKARLGRVGFALLVGPGPGMRSRKALQEKGFDTVARLAEGFGDTTETFGWITAIGPATYTELESNFQNANPFADMPPTQAFTLLLSSLSAAQQTALASKAGLGLNDLTTPTQKQLFAALVPQEEVKVYPRGNEEGREGEKNLGVLRDKLSGIHFRTAQQVRLLCEIKNQEYGAIDVPLSDADSKTKRYVLQSYNSYMNLDRVNGVVIRRQVPNRPKRSQLNYEAAALRVAVPIKDLKTVGDIIAAVSMRTGIKFYADARYETKKLTWVVSGRDSAPASEILQALAFCVTGTYRRVGTAFVLADDIAGVGTRCKIVQDFEEECDAQRASAVQDAQKTIKADPERKKQKFDSFGDPFAMTPEQEKAPPPNPQWHQGLAETALPLDKLTPRQQDAVADFEAAQKKQPTYDEQWAPDFTKNVHVVKDLSVQMLISGVDGEVSTQFGNELAPLYQSSGQNRVIPPEALKMFENLPKWTDAAKPYARRALISRPNTTAETDAAIQRVANIGFNELWLVVFENGKARIPGTPLPLDPACKDQPDLLAYAIAAGAKKGIKVCPVINFYAWGPDAPANLRLLTLRGEDSAHNASRRARINSLRPSPLNPDAKPTKVFSSPAVFVDPTATTVQSSLVALLRAVGGHVGAGDWICRSLTPPGFSGQDYNFSGLVNEYDGMGYNESLRQAFLEKKHCDPVDLRTQNYSETSGRANVSLPGFEAYSDYQSEQEWAKLRADTLQSAWRALFDSALSGFDEKKPTVLFAQGSSGAFSEWFDIWSDPKAPYPAPTNNLYVQQIEGAAGGKSGPASAIYFLAKTAPAVMPKELANYDWMSVQMKALEFYKGMRKWEGVAFEE